MRKILSLLVFLIASVIASQPSLAQSNIKLPTHCKVDESAYLNATMGTIVNNPKEIGGFNIVKNGKVLSLCVGKTPTRLIYRYGAIGKVEMEKEATAQKKFWYDSRTTSPVTGDMIVFFSGGNYTYYISQAIDQGHGVSLAVFKAGKIVVKLFSGTNRGVDYEGYEDNMAELPLDVVVGKDVPDPVP
jgi:hypothetical protein